MIINLKFHHLDTMRFLLYVIRFLNCCLACEPDGKMSLKYIDNSGPQQPIIQCLFLFYTLSS